MSGVIEIAAEAERPEGGASAELLLRRGAEEQSSLEDLSDDLPKHQVPATVEGSGEIEPQTWHAQIQREARRLGGIHRQRRATFSGIERLHVDANAIHGDVARNVKQHGDATRARSPGELRDHRNAAR